VNPNLHLTLAIPADHPALAGHFPGRPVVPGAIILAEVAQASVQALGAGTRITGFPAVKFISPMLPEQRCQLALTDNGAGVIAFELTHDSQRVASGNLRYERALSVP
jgi:3-hydroxyacyl-[acyl-carrier-protein] dehydratase